MSLQSKHKHWLLAVVKVLLAVGILAYLFSQIQAADGFERLATGKKNWALLLPAQAFVLGAFSLSFIRWCLLVRGVGLPFRLRDAFRLGSLGFMLNQVSPGSVGGDLLKAVFLAREQPGRRTEAVATVVVDRVIGLYALLLVASGGLLLAGESFADEIILASMKTIVWTATACGSLGLLLVASPLLTGQRMRDRLKHLPVVGGTIFRLIDAARVYRTHRGYVVLALGLALCTHSLLVSAFWFVSWSLPIEGRPTFAENASLVPIALVGGAMPLTPGGLGALKGGMEILYRAAGAGQGDGTIVALAYRALTYVVASIGAWYYFSARKKVDTMIHEAEELAEEIEE